MELGEYHLGGGGVIFYDDVISETGSSILLQIKAARVCKNTNICVRFTNTESECEKHHAG